MEFGTFAPINTGHLSWTDNTDERVLIDIVLTKDILSALYSMPSMFAKWSYTYNQKSPKEQESVFDGEEIFGVFMA